MPETEIKTLRDRSYVGLRARVREDERIFAIRQDRAGMYVGTVCTRTTETEDPVQRLRITQCSDPRLWYAGKVGHLVPLLSEDSEVYWSLEDAGYKNLVLKSDAEPVPEGNTAWKTGGGRHAL